MSKKVLLIIATIVAIVSVFIWQYDRFIEYTGIPQKKVEDVADEGFEDEGEEEAMEDDFDAYYSGFCIAYPMFQDTYFPYRVGYNFHPMNHTGPYDRYSGELGFGYDESDVLIP